MRAFRDMDIDSIVRAALAEDLPDITSESIFDAGERGRARFIVKAAGVLAGLRPARRAARLDVLAAVAADTA